jgi:hypothetical protein
MTSIFVGGVSQVWILGNRAEGGIEEECACEIAGNKWVRRVGRKRKRLEEEAADLRAGLVSLMELNAMSKDGMGVRE